jgi:hypothetical protein
MDDSPVMLSAAKHLAAQRDRPFAEFTLSGSEGLRVTVEVPISSSVLIFETALSRPIDMKLSGHNPTQGDRKGPRTAPRRSRPYKYNEEGMGWDVSLYGRG